MTPWYVDTSAALKLVQREAESSKLIQRIHEDGPTLVGSRLLETEMRRAAHRLASLSQQAVTDFLDKIDLYDLPGHVFTAAGLIAGTNLRSLDALHVSAAISIGADTVLTYDHRMAASARALGLRVLAPS